MPATTITIVVAEEDEDARKALFDAIARHPGLHLVDVRASAGEALHTAPREPFTEREKGILALLASGCTNAQIGEASRFLPPRSATMSPPSWPSWASPTGPRPQPGPCVLVSWMLNRQQRREPNRKTSPGLPEFRRIDFLRALRSYERRQRRHGA